MRVVQCLAGSSRNTAGFVVRPNQAMPWRTLLLLYLLIATVTLSIALGLFVIGYTLILPFSGLEILALGVALYVTAWRGGEQEVISINDNSIIVERGRELPEFREEFQRGWVRVVLERSWNSWYPSRLLVRSHGKELEIGRFLNEQERQGLALELQRALAADNGP